MVFSKRELEGYLLIDHSDSPGLAATELAAAHLPGNMPVGRGMTLEAPTLTCSHCQAIVVINPNRQRERAWCAKCDHYICDNCGAAMKTPGYEHKSFKEVIDDFLEAGAKGTPPKIIIPGRT
jgi:hypothetical protein